MCPKQNDLTPIQRKKLLLVEIYVGATALILGILSLGWYGRHKDLADLMIGEAFLIVGSSLYLAWVFRRLKALS